MPFVAVDLVPQPRHWEAPFGSWRGNIFELDPSLEGHAPILTSPDFELEAGKLTTFRFSAYFGGAANYSWHIVDARRGKLVHTRTFQSVQGDARFSLAFRARKTGKYRLVLEHRSHPPRGRTTIAAPAILIQGIGQGAVVKGRVADFSQARTDNGDASYLPHWSRLQRFIHRRCRASRRFNTVIAAVEMRLERHELLSLPQYMGLCPTGQCNALCDFCSVTTNRTGIIKKQLPYERLENFLAPVINTIQLFGIEGNGEPTLYTRFPELVERLTRGRAKAYLITNGSRLRLSDAPLLLALESVNFSLNAATAETHRRVMKLKNFDEIAALIRSLARERGVRTIDWAPQPGIYVTFVVTDDNVHEVQDFVRLAEQDLGADVVMVRPLSELGNEMGTVEDLRRIVPYESDVRDMIDAVQEYMRDCTGATEIRLSPETFRSSRPDPVGRVAMPRGFEGRLLAPRRTDWIALNPDVAVVWNQNSARIMLPAAKEALLRSQPIPVEPGRELTFSAQVSVDGGPARLTIVDSEGRTVADALLADTDGRMIPLRLDMRTGQASALSIVLAGEGRACTVAIDFERLRTPAPYVSNEFHIPPGRKWEICTPGVAVAWDDDVLTLSSATGGRPYLLKSYAIPCAQDATVEIPVELDVTRGLIEIGVLDASGQSYLQSFCFAEGRTAGFIFFNTGANDAVRLVVSAAPDQPVAATIRWRKPRLVPRDDGAGGSILLPKAPQWAACVPAVRVDRSADRLSMSWRGVGSPYLVKSNKVRCRPDQRAKAPMVVEVSEGQLGVGVLGAGGAAWLTTHTLETGMHQIDLDFDTSANDEVSFVLFAVDGASVTASAEFLANGVVNDTVFARTILDDSVEELAVIDAAPRKDSFETASATTAPGNGSVAAQAEVVAMAAAESSARQILTDSPLKRAAPSPLWPAIVGGRRPRQDDEAQPDRLPGQIMRWLTRGGVRYYCQKPWTDMNNFTVDGRMDVCCIATGASQEGYQLGNLNRQGFQEIWNGPMAQKFRRSVNSANKLPPCARCPMSYAYQGILFHPESTYREVNGRVVAILRKLKLSWMARYASRIDAYLISHILFRGFKR